MRARYRIGWMFVVGAIGCGKPPAGDPAGTEGDTEVQTGDESTTGVAPGTDETSGGADDVVGDESSTGEAPPPMIDCTAACSDLESEIGAAVCYSCRCKNAMDGWLPSVEEMQCSQAEDLVIYHADVSGPQAELVPATTDAETCANPSLLTGSCGVKSRLGQIQNGDVYVKWICRDFDEATGIYDDVGAIAYNLRTGATCWWDDVDYVTGQDDFPAIDLLDGDEENLARHLDVFYYTEGDHCTYCHDNDPFIFTPYLRSREWEMNTVPLAKYALVRPDGTLGPTPNQHLVSLDAKPCATCHRISAAGTCEFIAADSIGLYKDAHPYEAAVLDAAEPGSAYWEIAYWMPNGPVVPPIESYADWVNAFGAAAERVMQCCGNPGVQTPDCEWEPIPG